MMRTITQKTAGGPEVLVIAEVDDPTPGPGEVLVRVSAAGVNPVDAAVRGGYYPLLGNPPFTVGWDVSGTVEAIGPDVSGLAVGDAVFGLPRFPKQAAAYAEKIVAPANELARKPASLDFVQAGALPLAGLTAWQGLVEIGGLKKGQRALIHAGAGGVGHLAVQIAKARGAYVIATASTAKVDFVRKLGADQVIDYTNSDFTEQARDVDIALDPIGGDHPLETLKSLKAGGVLISLLDLTDAVKAEGTRRGVRLERISVKPDRDGLIELARLADSDQLEVHVEKTFPLAEAGAAQAFLATRPKGKVALTV
jgi:NADPH:quinone reductase-like Zn-dependent oxidoreductase